jgi:serine/threonine protein kinase
VSCCPESAVLHKLETGELPDDEADRLIPHVESCPACTARLEEFRAHDLDARVIRAAASDAGYTGGSVRQVAHAEADAGASGSRAGLVWDIPDYERVRLCGEGAFGSVWAVRNRVGVYRALKTIDLARLREADVRCRESTALETYCRHVQRHPNLIEIFHVGMQGEVLYYTMELADDDSTRKPVRGELADTYHPLTLHSLMQRGPISVNVSIEIVLQLLRGLSRLHATELAHRDIKPANIVFVGRRPKLADIGMITTDIDSPSRVGTPHYMPPDEQMDLTGDVYAMGLILHQLMVGAEPDRIPGRNTAFVAPSADWDLPAVQRMIDAACAPVAAQRYESAERMLETLEGCRQMSYDSLFAEIESSPRPPPAARRHAWVPVVVAALRALPWLGLLILASVLAHKFL